ncbi:MAG: aminomethyl-transferring glycine dehydrogenase subunit GcvPA [Pseudomonadales bacterium]|nr:aminomethyl-transferring glycine dehydrogenase subunit GcvPA [Pseudomonadales bacterium]
MPYIPHTDEDVKAMLDTIGVDSIDDLFDEIPKDILAKNFDIPEGISEMEMVRLMSECAAADSNVSCFIGAGAYEHHIPAAVWDVVSRGEFLTAYTPYQAEASQGTLQVIYEYQTNMANLTAMDVSNASLYDGGSGMAEAALMAIRANRKSKSRKILVPRTVSPLYRDTAHNIVNNQNIELVDVNFDSEGGNTTLENLKQYEGEDFAALIIAQPNFFGVLEDVNELTDWAHANGMLVIAVVNPTSLALLTPPGEWGESGADIAVGEGQPLGVPLSSGGPYFGFICCKQKIVRQMPGRIIGRTVDMEGKEGFTLTLQAREQHIRRSKATSNICTNQGLVMTASTIYVALLGADGLALVAEACHENTNQLSALLTSIDGVETVFNRPVFHEQVIRLPGSSASVLEKLAEARIQGGIDLSTYYPELENCVLFCATETKTNDDLVAYQQALASVLAS